MIDELDQDDPAPSLIFDGKMDEIAADITLRTKMIPDAEHGCQTSEAAVRGADAYQKIKNAPEGEAASVTAWKRYQQLVAIVESRGGKFNRKSMIEAIFRGNNLVYASH
ncbi:hypothetical protein WN55_04703 [Dufourea novaeangliae]|uniref:Uncharacterized protein n=1 Tax=Dufourea novaeangliae TaxID=178035 RepID=A0A154P1Q1_DUFNO|nr:hypothetical protein WN55_04703 [Dufourea novaeangliae]